MRPRSRKIDCFCLALGVQISLKGSCNIARSQTFSLPNSRPTGPFNHTRHHADYRVPHTDTILNLQYGPHIAPVHISTLLSFVHEELSEQVLDWGQEGVLPEGEYDYTSEQMIEFSVYSATEVREYEPLTWRIVRNVVDGLMDLLIIQMRHRQVVFRVVDGPDRIFVGYGHLAQNMRHEEHWT